MEASQHGEDQPEVEAQVGVSGEDIAAANEEHQPLAAEDEHGTTTPRSAPPVSTQSGDPLDAATKAGLGLGGEVPAQGGATPAGAAGDGEGAAQ